VKARETMLRQMIRESVEDPRPPDNPHAEALRLGIARSERTERRHVWADNFVAGYLTPYFSAAGHVEGRAFEEWSGHLDGCDVCATGRECAVGKATRGRWHLAYALLRLEDKERGVVYK
jgi:hypothetical protein